MWCHNDVMDLTRYVDDLQHRLAVTADAAGDDARQLAERLTAPLDAAVRLVLLDALSAAAKEVPLLVVLDLMLPDVGGEQVIQDLKALADVPVIMLTSRSSEEDRVAGLALGADDYVVKPFSPRELVLRVKAVLKRTRRDDLSDAEAVSFERTRITSRDWAGYPILRFADLPDSVEVHLIDRPGEPFLGTGEAAQGPAAGALDRDVRLDGARRCGSRCAHDGNPGSRNERPKDTASASVADFETDAAFMIAASD